MPKLGLKPQPEVNLAVIDGVPKKRYFALGWHESCGRAIIWDSASGGLQADRFYNVEDAKTLISDARKIYDR